MREIIALHLGQAGIQIGGEVWQQLYQEHSNKNQSDTEKNAYESFPEEFYKINKTGPPKARAMFFDFESDPNDTLIREGRIFDTINPSNMINGKESASSNYVRGYYTLARDVIEKMLDQLRKNIEECDSPNSIMPFFSICGGSGSGLAARITDRIKCDYPKITRINHIHCPSPNQSQIILEPYNNVLCLADLNNIGSNLDIMFNNEGLYGLLSEKEKIDSPNYSDANRLFAKFFRGYTAPYRYNGSDGSKGSPLHTMNSLKIFPRMSMVRPSFSPIISGEQFAQSQSAPSLGDIVEDAFDEFNSFLAISINQRIYGDPQKMLTSSLTFNGMIPPSSIKHVSYQLLSRLKSEGNLVESMSRNPLQINMCSETPFSLNCSYRSPKQELAVLQANYGVRYMLDSIINKYDKMYAKRAFIHWYYGEGLSSGFFECSYEELQSLKREYDDNFDVKVEEDSISSDSYTECS